MATDVRQPEVLPNPAADRCPQKKPGRLTLQLDELWSFVGCKENKQWLWLAMDVDTREIVGVYLGDRTVESLESTELNPDTFPDLKTAQRAFLGIAHPYLELTISQGFLKEGA
ncbi:MAG: hypothetical protein BRC59_10140 [Cyanobacteria bacterium SW_4_48_29]|nr:MAG: hypothetical protein BRC59_10140 [Cyanobacteria bacterium SW_4_48_29]